MARVWQEGFEGNLHHGDYIEGNPDTSYWKGIASTAYPSDILGNGMFRVTGRNSYSQYALCISNADSLIKTLDTTLSEFYFRVHVKNLGAINQEYAFLQLKDTSGNILVGVYDTTSANIKKLKVRYGGTLTDIGTFTLNDNTWYKIDIYYKVDSSTGAYELKIDNLSTYSASSLNTGALNLNSIQLSYGGISGSDYAFDDIALNDTSGSVNNSWCGDGTIVGLNVKGAGNYSQWDESQGWTLAENGTTTTNLEITGHGLSDNDVIYNVTRDAYRIVTKVDDNNLTVSSVTSQAENDIIVAFTNAATITAGAGTDTSKVVLSGHNLSSYEVFVNTSRSNAIRRAIYINGTSVYNYDAALEYNGSQVSSQASGDSIKTFNVKYYTISDHYKAVYSAKPNPKYSNIQSDTSNDIDTFDMEELVADKSIPANAGIIAVSLGIFATEKGSGSQIKHMLRSGSTDDTGDAVSLSGGSLEYQKCYSISPFTSSQFTISEVDGLEAGVKVV